MSNPIIKIIDLASGEETQRPMNKLEYEKYLIIQEEDKIMSSQILEKQAARQSALEKLAALGLTEAEIAALAG